MSIQVACMFCESSNPKREKDNMIRCERFSEWRKPGDSCKEYFAREFAEKLELVRRRKETE